MAAFSDQLFIKINCKFNFAEKTLPVTHVGNACIG